MPTRLTQLVFDTADLVAQAEFWSALLGWRHTYTDAEEAVVEPPSDGPLELVFVPVQDPKTAKNRIHLDLSSTSPDDQAAVVARAESLGAQRISVGQAEVPWVVLADPEGNEFCVLEPRAEYASTGALAAIVVDTADVAASARFWAAAAGWDIVRQEEFASLRHPSGSGPWLEFLPAGPRTVKNRLHLDVRPHAGDVQAEEVARLRALGARTADVGQGEVTWVVLADPDGGEFCVLSPR
ncbi:putative enzyme related to lactoylglutathione lyase [Crossiella equi]|uniref:Enzyme related to lactoylglutathione lyase n=1 Tax=Crossiella equi TaxID=130796 RepID=A0ABS5A740_9PSEU|nr:VOC family protein [Crossiella equi]MBP2472417.1 putative enzyme related to lactoylglutathione lyase [Crossiella equi]